MDIDEVTTGVKSVVIDGSTVSVADMAALKDAIKNAAEAKSLRNFKVFVAGNEIVRASDLVYDEVSNGAEISITPFDKAGEGEDKAETTDAEPKADNAEDAPAEDAPKTDDADTKTDDAEPKTEDKPAETNE